MTEMTDLSLAEGGRNPASAPPEHLLAALEQAGRTPDRALLEACLNRRDELIPGLLEMLESGVEQGDDEAWDDDDPRWYRDIHAGLFLIAFREEKALPIFANVLRDEGRENLLEWYDRAFVHYGPRAVDMLIDLLKDRNAFLWGRIFAAVRLSRIALLHPETQDRIADVLRMRLPRVDEAGNFVIPQRADDDQVEFWTFVACELAELKDAASQPQVKALYRAGLIDEMVMGNVDDYLRIFEEEDRSHRLPGPFDLITFYHPPRVSPLASAARERKHESAEPEFGTLLEDGGATYTRAERKVGRNDPCPCGSGKKYKRCCGRR